MLRADSARPASGAEAARGFLLYLEGAGDRAIVEGWCRRLQPSLAGALSRATVILGGRRPARALAHFRERGGQAAGLRGLCVLDRDGGGEPQPPADAEPGLEFFTWSRRHIESYLLLPGAIRRGMRLRERDGRAGRALRELLPAATSEAELRGLDAKRLLAADGSLARALGRPIPLGQVARATRESELHADVRELFDRLLVSLGPAATEVVRS